MNIVFVSSEVVPFAKTGGLADVCGALPIALERLGHQVSIILPNYRSVGEHSRFSERADITTIAKDIKVYFIRHKAFYDRAGLYGDSVSDHPDNAGRFAFLCHGAMELMREIAHPVDIIHCHDWQTALIPVLLKENYSHDPFFARTRSVFTIHNLAYQGIFPAEEFSMLGVPQKLFNDRQMEFYDKVNLMKAGIIFSDQVTTVSPQYAKEILTKEWGCGLEGVLQSRRNSLAGILNGLDYERWDPATDEFLEPKFSAEDWLAKTAHKAKLQKLFHLPVHAEIPVFGFVGRLCYQKGLDLIESAIEELMRRPLQMVFLGVGEDRYQKLLTHLAYKYPQQFSVQIKYDEDISHEVYAGADFFLMPSVYEPCGLTQMIALRYGTIPVVPAVGGLFDTVTDYSSDKKKGNGFVIPSYSVSGLLAAVDRSVGIYNQKAKYAEMVTHAMACRYTWQAAAQHYVEVYQECA